MILQEDFITTSNWKMLGMIIKNVLRRQNIVKYINDKYQVESGIEYLFKLEPNKARQIMLRFVGR